MPVDGRAKRAIFSEGMARSRAPLRPDTFEVEAEGVIFLAVGETGSAEAGPGGTVHAWFGAYRVTLAFCVFGNGPVRRGASSAAVAAASS